MNKWILSSVVFVLSISATGFIGFYVAIFLIGPHSDVIPEILQTPVRLLLLMIIIWVPLWLGRKTFTLFKRKEKK